MSAQTVVWLIILLIAVGDGIALRLQGMSLDWTAEWHNLLLLPLFLALARLLEWLRQPQAARFTTVVTQALTAAHVGTILSYVLTAASPFPLADSLFDRADIALGFDWLAWFNWIDQHPVIHNILILSYNSMIPQFLIMIAVFSYASRKRLDELLVESILAIIIILPILYLLPSVGAFTSHGITGRGDWEIDILRMRSHAVLVVVPREGIVTFPSYHTIMGVLFINMARGSRRLFYPLLLLNALLMVSVMSVGGHYLVDMIGGIALGFVALGAARYLLARCSPEAMIMRDALAAPMPV